MIVNDLNAISTKQKMAIEFIEESAIPFYPIGSRFFGTDDEVSDYDFFTDVVFEKELIAVGFIKTFDPKYTGNSDLNVAVYEKENVDVILVKPENIPGKIEAVKLAKSLNLSKVTTKNNKILWKHLDAIGCIIAKDKVDKLKEDLPF